MSDRMARPMPSPARAGIAFVPRCSAWLLVACAWSMPGCGGSAHRSPPSTNAALAGLSSLPGTLAPAFAGATLAYSANVGDESSVVRTHSGNGHHEEMVRRAIACFDEAMTDVGIVADDPGDPGSRASR